MEGQITSSPTTGSNQKKRTTRACNICRARKVKCDGNVPCSRCSDSHVDCIYPGGVRSRSDGGNRPIAPRPLKRKQLSNVQTNQELKPDTRTYDDPVTNKKQQELRAGIGAFDSNTDAYQFYGPSSHFSFVQRLYQRIRRQSNAPLNVSRQVPEGLKKWGIERQIFTHGDESSSHQTTIPDGSFLPKELGDAFISSYFTIMHPQGPILIERDVRHTWEVLWNGPGLAPDRSTKFAKEKSILYMVLAIGARLTDSPSSNAWAQHFYERAGVPTDCFEETSLLGTHLVLLRVRLSRQKSSDTSHLFIGTIRNADWKTQHGVLVSRSCFAVRNGSRSPSCAGSSRRQSILEPSQINILDDILHGTNDVHVYRQAFLLP